MRIAHSQLLVQARGNIYTVVLGVELSGPILSELSRTKSIDVTNFEIFKFYIIISGLWNNLQNHRWLPECHNKHFEEGFGKYLQK
jgi:hypothetical protein